MQLTMKIVEGVKATIRCAVARPRSAHPSFCAMLGNARLLSQSATEPGKKIEGFPNESSIAGAQHKPSLSGPSIGHLVSELSSTTPEMLKRGQRVEGQTVSEEQRTFARRVAIALVGLPCMLAGGAGAYGLAHKMGVLEYEHQRDPL